MAGSVIERLGEPISILDATPQELQLELIRRAKFAPFDGERVARALMAHRDLWISAILDRQPHWSVNYSHLPALWLVRLRDLPRGVWNADTLFVLTDSIEKAEKLKEVATDEDTHWCGDITIHDNREEVDRAWGTGRKPYVIFSVSWD